MLINNHDYISIVDDVKNRIREAQLQKIPYILVIGEKEMSSGTVSVRRHTKGDLGAFSVEDVVLKIRNGE